jgi:hypothetical protein
VEPPLKQMILRQKVASLRSEPGSCHTAACDDHNKGHPEAEIEDLLGLGVELLVRPNYGGPRGRTSRP